MSDKKQQKSIDTNVKKDIKKAVLPVILCIQIILIFWCNLQYLPKYLDGDFAKLATHIVEMAEKGALAIPGWKYTTTAEWDCVTLFALPLYCITHRLYLSLAIGNLIITLLFTAVCFLIFDDRKTALISANLLLIPYEFGILSYCNMLFYGGSQYSIKVLVPLLLIGVSLKLAALARDGKKPGPALIAASAVLLFLILTTTASSGIYGCMCGIFPIVAAYMIWHYVSRKRISGIWLLLALAGIILAGAGILINRKVMGGTRADSLSFVTFQEYCDGYISRALAGFFSVFGASTVNGNVYITSAYGVFLFLRILFVLLLIYAIAASVKITAASMIKTDSSAKAGSAGDQTVLRDVMLLASFFWNLLIILVADVRAGSPTFEYRYYLIGTVPALFLLAERLSALHYKTAADRRTVTAAVYVLLLMAMLLGCYRNIVTLWDREGDVHREYRELTGYCEENGIDTLYIYDRSHETDICRLLSSGTMYVDVLPNGYTWVNDYYASYEGPLETSECYVAVPAVSAVFDEGERIFGRDAHLIHEIGSIKIYRLSQQSDIS
ncbi:MAG: hypothetical protein ILP17_12575 [Lachnospiraceae bacterium]|nr:hypothetical protein [Lachnospiraceae bacterium]